MAGVEVLVFGMLPGEDVDDSVGCDLVFCEVVLAVFVLAEVVLAELLLAEVELSDLMLSDFVLVDFVFAGGVLSEVSLTVVMVFGGILAMLLLVEVKPESVPCVITLVNMVVELFEVTEDTVLDRTDVNEPILLDEVLIVLVLVAVELRPTVVVLCDVSDEPKLV